MSRRNKGQLATNQAQTIQALQQEVTKFVANQSLVMSRLTLAASGGTSHSGNRDLDAVFGYNKDPKPADYMQKYKRQDLAGAIIDAFPDATWKEDPIVEEVTEDKERTESTQFEQDWQAIQRRVNIFEYMKRADKLAGLGNFSILVLGFSDSDNLETPVVANRGAGDPLKLLWLRPYAQTSIEIKSLVADNLSEHYGMPEIYEVEETDPADLKKRVKKKIHHTRVVHVAENLLEDDIFGRPSLERIYDRLDDIAKIAGGDAELFWLNGRGIWNAKADADAKFSPEDSTAITDSIDDAVHGLRRFMKTKGVTMEALQMQVPSVKEHIEVQVDLIAGAKRIPKRLLMGSERGELSSAQDGDNWIGEINQRRNGFARPRVLYPFIDRCLDAGVLTAPTLDYVGYWSTNANISPKDAAEIASKMATALQAIFGFDAATLPAEFIMEHVLGLPADVVAKYAPLIETDGDPFTDDGEGAVE